MDELISKSHLWKGWILPGKIEMVKLIQDGISLVTNNMAHFKNMLSVWDDALKLFNCFLMSFGFRVRKLVRKLFYVAGFKFVTFQSLESYLY